jgi:prevent-host-death family protein
MAWQVQDAKQRFSELLRCAHAGGPQIITRHGQEVAVVIDIADYWHLKGDVTDFKDYLRAGPGLDEIELSRTTEVPRGIDWTNDA